ncbi:hypothetical protein [Macrococcus sp. DPC7161]|uniref:hypothetical protein n=1 Tax=Macrococcus sp. DPC7161 TaxID=2507060 RepID=UPI00100B7944|nr:hypothetical protein [Macrococcus sp. DPC7161]RXK19182.1 hypothetical protein ER639_02375 [Macrococcus sp. DPC7161]
MKKVIVYFFLLVIPFVISLIYFDILKITPQTIKFHYKNGEMIDSAPFPPSLDTIFGVDRNGNQMLFVVLEGYKTTFLIIFLVTFIVMLFSIVFGTFVAMKFQNLSIIKSISNPFIFIPQSIIAYILLYPMIYEPIDHFKTTIEFRMFYFVLVLVLLTIPITITLIIDVTKLELQKLYIDSAKTMTPSNFYIFLKHILPNMWQQYTIVACRMMFQTIIVITHLAFFKLYFGGTDVCYGPACLYIEKPIMNELSSLVGYHFMNIGSAWWTFYSPLFAILYMLMFIHLIQHKLEQIIGVRK